MDIVIRDEDGAVALLLRQPTESDILRVKAAHPELAAKIDEGVERYGDGRDSDSD